MGCSCPEVYGDPGILISDLFPRRMRLADKLGVIPHYEDREHPFVKTAQGAGALVIDPTLPLEEYLTRLQKCECVISSSLDGIILAHSYGIPATWIKLSNRVVGDGFKFHDYYESIGFASGDIQTSTADDELGKLIRVATVPRERINREALRQALEDAQQYIWDCITSCERGQL